MLSSTQSLGFLSSGSLISWRATSLTHQTGLPCFEPASWSTDQGHMRGSFGANSSQSSFKDPS